jgi:peptidoglycan hydrolase-like protein with peptidoglycan-binding domain
VSARPRARRAGIAVAAGLAIAAAAVAAAAAAHARSLSIEPISPGPGDATNSRTPSIALRLSRDTRLERLTVTVDGARVHVSVTHDGARLTLHGLRLSDGPHWIAVDAAADGLLGGDASRRWRFTVDTTPPPLALTSPLPRYLNRTPLALAGTSEAGARVVASAGGETATARAGDGGGFELRLPLAEGERTVRLTAADEAGNRRSEVRRIAVDTEAPAVALRVRARTKDAQPRLRWRVRDAHPLATRALLDGRPLASPGRPALPLSDGVHVLRVRARDAAGNRTSQAERFLVDSTDQLGKATLTHGARGADVRRLQSLLRRGGYLHRPPTGVLDRPTQRAVRRFQRSQSLTVDGVVGPFTAGALIGHIVIDQSEHLLTLYRLGDAPVSFAVAVGQAAYPTPNGEYTIIAMVENPTWVPPPDAPWAKGAVPIPPGPGNPLGTRWMGISAPGVGIHGTDDPGSIGYSVSHGCIRMQIPDAERLFTMVSLGMRVTIQA